MALGARPECRLGTIEIRSLGLVSFRDMKDVRNVRLTLVASVAEVSLLNNIENRASHLSSAISLELRVDNHSACLAWDRGSGMWRWNGDPSTVFGATGVEIVDSL